MSSEFERLLRAAGEELPGPDESARSRARGRALAALRRRRLRVPIRLAVGASLIVAVGLGIGIGVIVVPSGSARSSPEGLGFLPAKGWTVVQSAGPGEAAGAVAANVPVRVEDEPGSVPVATLSSLPSGGIVIVATLATRGETRSDGGFPLGELPLRLADAGPARTVEAGGRELLAYRLRAGVGGYNVETQVFFAESPAPATLAAADRQLGRLVVAPERVTLVVRPGIVGSGARLTVFGSIASGKADEKVTVQFKGCGLYPREFRDVLETTTREGGGYSFDHLEPFTMGVSGVFRSVWDGAASAEVEVKQRAGVGLYRNRDGSFEVRVPTLLSLWRKTVLLQRLDQRTGRFVTMRRIGLAHSEGMEVHQIARQSWIQNWTDSFRPAVPEGTTLRAVLPLAQAKPCYLAGYSNPVRT